MSHSTNVGFSEPPRRYRDSALFEPRPFAIPTSGVGQEPPSISLVRRPAVGSAKASPSRVIPACGQVSENDAQSASKDRCDVLQEQVAGSYDASDSEDLSIQAASRSLTKSSPLSSAAKILARETRCDAIHSARPLGWIPQPHVSFVHVQVGEPSLVSSLPENGAAAGIDLDGADWLVSEDEVRKEPTSYPGE
jgi:hypothetical protein